MLCAARVNRFKKRTNNRIKLKVMAIIKTTEDGWDCVPELKDEVVYAYEEAADIIYEINNCVRQTELPELIERLRDMCGSIEMTLDSIDEDQEFETINEE